MLADVSAVDPSLPPTTTPPGSAREIAALARLGEDDLELLLELEGIRLNVRPESLLELDDGVELELELEPELELPELPSEPELDPDEPDEDEPDDPDDVLPPRGIA